MIKVLIEAGANINAPVYDLNLSVASSPETLSTFPVIGNCLSEAIDARDELVLLLVLNNFNYNEDGFSLAYRHCLDMCQTEVKTEKSLNDKTSSFNGIKAIQYLLRCKVVVDPEYKVQMKSSVFNSASKSVNQENGIVLKS